MEAKIIERLESNRPKTNGNGYGRRSLGLTLNFDKETKVGVYGFPTCALMSVLKGKEREKESLLTGKDPKPTFQSECFTKSQKA